MVCHCKATCSHLCRAGIPLTGALVIFAALEQTLANPAVIAQLAAMIPALRASVNGPDTVVTLACAPARWPGITAADLITTVRHHPA